MARYVFIQRGSNEKIALANAGFGCSTDDLPEHLQPFRDQFECDKFTTTMVKLDECEDVFLVSAID